MSPTAEHPSRGLVRKTLRPPGGSGLTLRLGVRSPSANSPCLLLLHGTGSSHESFAPLWDRLPTDYGLVIPDLPGHGESAFDRSPIPAFGLNVVADWLSWALEALDLHPTLVIGHSAGAAAGLVLTIRQPRLPLVGLAPSLVPPPALYTHLLGPWMGPLIRSLPSLALGHWLTGHPAVIHRMLDSTGSRLPQSQQLIYERLFKSRSHLEGTLSFMAGTELADLLADERLSEVECLRLIAARDDRWIAEGPLSRLVQRALPQAQVQWLPSGGHLFHEVDPTAVLACLASLIRP